MENEFTQTELGKYLGVWQYNFGGKQKYWRVLPHLHSKFIIQWGTSLEELDYPKSPNKIIIDDSEECYRRILSKARGRYVLVGQMGAGGWTPQCHDEFNSVEEILEMEQTEARKRKPRKRKLSLLDWMGGQEEYRENDSL